MPQIMTVTGPIEPEHLGVTYAHEHLLGGPVVCGKVIHALDFGQAAWR